MRELVAVARVSRTRTELRVHDHRPGLARTEQTERLIAIVQRAGTAAGIGFEIVPSSAAGSSAFAGALGIPTLDGMGPAGADLMTEREHIELKSLGERALLLALTLHLLAIEKGGSA